MTPKQKNVCCILLILAVVVFYTLAGGSVGISLDFREDALCLSASHYDWEISYGKICTLELVQLADPGQLVEGAKRSTLCCGTWENELWGSYTLCIDPRVETCVAITMDDDSVCVLNYESNDATQQLYQMFTDLLQNKTAPA